MKKTQLFNFCNEINSRRFRVTFFGQLIKNCQALERCGRKSPFMGSLVDQPFALFLNSKHKKDVWSYLHSHSHTHCTQRSIFSGFSVSDQWSPPFIDLYSFSAVVLLGAFRHWWWCVAVVTVTKLLFIIYMFLSEGFNAYIFSTPLEHSLCPSSSTSTCEWTDARKAKASLWPSSASACSCFGDRELH